MSQMSTWLMGKGNKTSDFTIKEIAIYFFVKFTVKNLLQNTILMLNVKIITKWNVKTVR